jgi:hypothetical protein
MRDYSNLCFDDSPLSLSLSLSLQEDVIFVQNALIASHIVQHVKNDHSLKVLITECLQEIGRTCFIPPFSLSHPRKDEYLFYHFAEDPANRDSTKETAAILLPETLTVPQIPLFHQSPSPPRQEMTPVESVAVENPTVALADRNATPPMTIKGQNENEIAELMALEREIAELKKMAMKKGLQNKMKKGHDQAVETTKNDEADEATTSNESSQQVDSQATVHGESVVGESNECPFPESGPERESGPKGAREKQNDSLVEDHPLIPIHSGGGVNNSNSSSSHLVEQLTLEVLSSATFMPPTFFSLFSFLFAHLIDDEHIL